jgi:hypothetical protein
MTDRLNRANIVTAVAGIVTAIGATALVRLFTAGPSPSAATFTLDDFTEPEGTWYDPTDAEHPTVVYGQPFLNADGGVEVRAESVQFNFVEAEGNEAQDIVGYMVTAATGNTVHHYAYLPESVLLSGNLSSIIVQPGFALPPVEQDPAV